MEQLVRESGYATMGTSGCGAFGHAWIYHEIERKDLPCCLRPRQDWRFCRHCGEEDRGTEVGHIWVEQEHRETWDIWKALREGEKGCGWCWLIVHSWEETRMAVVNEGQRREIANLASSDHVDEAIIKIIGVGDARELKKRWGRG